MSFSNRSVCILAGVFILSAGAFGAETEPWTPEQLYQGLSDKQKGGSAPANRLPRDAVRIEVNARFVPGAPALAPIDPSRAAGEVARWATQPSTGLHGRPLPIAGSWNAQANGWSPAYHVELIRNGHHVPVGFLDPSGRAFMAKVSQNGAKAAQEEIANYYRPALEFAREHKLPIVFRGWNWGAEPVNYQEKRSRLGKKKIPLDRMAALLVGGKPQRQTDPFGPIEAWQDWGRFWLGNEMMKELQGIYPDPPLVMFLNNNEAGDLHSATGVEKSDRFVAKYGSGLHSKDFIEKAVREGYEQRYAAMFEAARGALIQPAWKQNFRTIAYNTLLGPAYAGNGNQPQPGIWFDMGKGWTKWRIFDGSMPELYDNDWQPGKKDDVPWSMQAEAGPLYAMQSRVFAERPDFHWTAITWDGAVTSEVFRGRRGTSKPYVYATNGRRWNFERYEGWLQFCLWASRPRMYYEFRAGEPLDAMRRGTWEAQLRCVDRPWGTAMLKDFWAHGTLVENSAEQPWFDQLPQDAPQWLKEMPRWFLLTTDANPPRASWESSTRLSLFAQALVLGQAPARRWLVYAHAPNGPVVNARIAIPEFGGIQLPTVPRSGSFFVLSEAERTVRPLLEGGPSEIVARIQDVSVTAGQWFAPGTPVRFGADLHAPGMRFTRIKWTFGDGAGAVEQGTLAPVSHSFARAGTYVVTVEAHGASGQLLSDQLAVNVGEQPAESLVYDLPLDDALSWEGPWIGIGEGGQELATYRHVPNRGRASMPIVTGGAFVDDTERGRVFEIAKDHGGIWLQRSKATTQRERPVGQGDLSIQSDRTVSFWFKPKDVSARQVLFATGFEQIGTNIYLLDGRLYAGSWATADGAMFNQDPVFGYKWNGDWISSEPLQPNRWYHVAWVLKDGKARLEPDRQMLYLDGKLVGTARGAGLPVEYVPPRIGRTNMGGDRVAGKQRTLTRFHDQEQLDALPAKERENRIPVFRGRIDDFKFISGTLQP